jgi:transcriptional regulator with XRE-family HTH domain
VSAAGHHGRVDDHRIGRSLFVLRRRRRLSQAELGRRAGVSQSTVSLVERGHLDRLTIRTVRRLLGAVDAGFAGRVVWRGGALDRLLDERHARLVEVAASAMRGLGWTVEVEVSYAIGRELGSIDILGCRALDRAAAMLEVKSEITSIEELGRRSDAKERLLQAIVESRWGFRPIHVARILVVEDRSSVRDRIARHATTFESTFPERTVAVRRWLRTPVGRLAGIWFLRPSNGRGGSTRP